MRLAAPIIVSYCATYVLFCKQPWLPAIKPLRLSRSCTRFHWFRRKSLGVSFDTSVDTLANVITIVAVMRFPLPLTTKVARYIIAEQLRATHKSPTVLHLGPFA